MPDDKLTILEDSDRKKRPKWEYVLFGAMFGAVLWILIVAVSSEIHHIQKMRLRNQLWQMRNAIIIYYVVNGNFPPNISKLVEAKVENPDGSVRPLLEHIKVNRDGEVVDPLGYNYIYNSVTGSVLTAAPCCKDW